MPPRLVSYFEPTTKSGTELASVVAQTSSRSKLFHELSSTYTICAHKCSRLQNCILIYRTRDISARTRINFPFRSHSCFILCISIILLLVRTLALLYTYAKNFVRLYTQDTKWNFWLKFETSDAVIGMFATHKSLQESSIPLPLLPSSLTSSLQTLVS